ncbi:AMP-binding protein, partial [Photobacterium sanctipauli]|uniref:AMP-binding protein n=1 Tax=Photobacterium sanctipauli TaxID=1342794 RepID=UPI0013630383
LFIDSLRKFGSNTAIVTDKGERLTYTELADEIDKFAQEIGDEAKLVVVEAKNEIQPLIAYLAALRGGHPVILLADGATDNSSQILDVFKPDILFKKNQDDQWALHFLENASKEKLNPELCVLLSTSGTTGSAKLVRLSKLNIHSNAESIAKYLDINSSHKVPTTLPFQYSFGMSIINSHLSVGACLLLTDKSISDNAFWRLFTEESATSLYGVPYTYELLDKIDFVNKDLPSLKYLAQAGGRLSQELVLKFLNWSEKNNKELFVMYGQTEASPRIAYVPSKDLKYNTDCIGLPIPGGDLSIIDENGIEIQDIHTPGELVYSGPNVMMGYAYSKEDLSLGCTLSSLKTGDLACRNENGMFKIVGRMNRFSKIYGLRISLDEVEQYLESVGVKAIVNGNDTHLIVATLNVGESDNIIKLLQKKLSLNASALYVKELDEYPLLKSGKIDYKQLMSYV